nr:MAG TPA: hypothetical protein [Bacteriophage sp.]
MYFIKIPTNFIKSFFSFIRIIFSSHVTRWQ